MCKSHQIHVESLVSYLNNELGLKQEGDLKHWKKKRLILVCAICQ